MTTGVDASFSHQDAAQLAADGVKALGRYCPGGGADLGKCLTADELLILNGHGIAVWLVYELTADRWRGGRAAGLTDGAAARAGARALGWPDTRPIYSAYDTNAGPSDRYLVLGYQQGFNEGQAVPAGGAAYGDGYVLETLTGAGLIAYRWLSDSTAFYDSAAYTRSGQASIVQFYGRTLPGLSGIDVDDLLTVDFGQFPAPSAPPPPPPTPIPSEAEMFMFQERGSASVNVAGVGARGYCHIDSPARLTEWAIILTFIDPGAPTAGKIFPVNPGFGAALAAGSLGAQLGTVEAPAEGPPVRDVLPADAPNDPIDVLGT